MFQLGPSNPNDGFVDTRETKQMAEVRLEGCEKKTKKENNMKVCFFDCQ